jgi:S-adenosylmethionine synthetase
VACSTSLQQTLGGPAVELHRAALDLLSHELSRAARAIPGFIGTVPADVTINGAGDFAVGGPEGDNGLSGKKLVADAYGPRVPIGGGALSGKDFYKADRGGAILARRLAKAVVVSGAADECTATLAFFPGMLEARIVGLHDGVGVQLDPKRWARLLDLSLAGVGDRYTGVTDLVDVARAGHFLDPARPWEQLRFDDCQAN